jgi:5-oxopent-3-ene-1,2,5-tricarboxylate decarboxylase / 2-hydroxyhepta-2,4-diene-1,7-dioate isomerase
VKRARIVVDDREDSAVLVEPGVLVDSRGAKHSPDKVRFLAPVVPGKILGLALNYSDHATELGMQTPSDPAIFFKPTTSLIGHREQVVYPTGVEYMHYENELAVVIGHKCRRVTAGDAMNFVGGYTIANDVTVRDFVTNLFRPPVKAKGWDTFLPMGPYLVENEILDPNDLGIRTYVNGELRQSGRTANLLIKIPQFIEYVSEFMTLEVGDVLLTGTPKGVSHINPGDRLSLEIDQLGALESVVVAEARDRTRETAQWPR